MLYTHKAKEYLLEKSQGQKAKSLNRTQLKRVSSKRVHIGAKVCSSRETLLENGSKTR